MIVVNPSLKNIKKVRSSPEDDENKQNLASACGQGNGEACYYLARIYQDEGNNFVAGKLLERACSLNYAPACVRK